MLTNWAGGEDASPEDQLVGIRLLDLFAGSGAIGLEAASRGAELAVLVENHHTTVDLVRRNVTTTGLAERVRVQPVSVSTFLAGAPETFDVVWLDPPYALPGREVDAILERIAEGWLVDDGLVVVERSRRDPAPRWPPGLPVHWSRRYGETQLHFGRPAPDPEVDHE